MISNLLYRLGVMTLAFGVLFISVTKTGLQLVASEGDLNTLKKNEIGFKIKDKNGEISDRIYKLPEVRTLPDNALYGFKRIRDYLWINLITGTKKIELSVLMADKKVYEFGELSKNENPDVAVEAGNEAIDKLEYADNLVSKLRQTDPDYKKFRSQIYLAGFAYKAVFERERSKFSLDAEKYNLLLKRINERNNKQEENRYAWDF